MVISPGQKSQRGICESVVMTYSYEAFGNLLSSLGSLTQPYQYVGEEYYYTEGDIGLQLLGQRWYDAEVGRFVSRDPIGYLGGINLYVYCWNNPVSLRDPIGLRSKKQECLQEAKMRFQKCMQGAKDFWDTIYELCEKATKACGVRYRCMQECLGITPNPKTFPYLGKTPHEVYEQMEAKCREQLRADQEKCKKCEPK